MGILYVMSGTPGSGKTSFIKDHFWNSDKIWYISRDEIRFSLLKDGEDYFAHENEVFKKFTSEISEYLKKDFDVVADATHLTRASRRKLFNNINYHLANKIVGINIIAVGGLEELIKRNTKRQGKEKVPEQALINMYNRYVPISFAECPFDEVWDIKTGIDIMNIK